MKLAATLVSVYAIAAGYALWRLCCAAVIGDQPYDPRDQLK